MRLTDAEKRNRENPDTFQIPDKEERENLPVGAFAKLIFNDRERMWVRITEFTTTDYEGVLDNEPVVVKMKIGDKVRFKAKHVIDYFLPKE